MCAGYRRIRVRSFIKSFLVDTQTDPRTENEGGGSCESSLNKNEPKTALVSYVNGTVLFDNRIKLDLDRPDILHRHHIEKEESLFGRFDDKWSVAV